MFSNSPTQEQYDALRNLVRAQGERIAALANLVEVLAPMAKRARHEAVFLTGLVAALSAEIAGRCDNPYQELMSILGRVRFTLDHFKIDGEDSTQFSKEMSELVAEYAENYLRRGEASSR